MGWMDESNIEVQEKIIKKHNCKQDDDVCIELWFITDLNYATYRHYFQLPRTMIERKICQIKDRNPNLIKILNKRHFVTKHWCFQHEDGFGIMRIFLPGIWMELEPIIIKYSNKGFKSKQKFLMFSKISTSISTAYTI